MNEEGSPIYDSIAKRKFSIPLRLRAHFKTHVRVSEADERGAELKETNVEHRPLHAHTTSVVPGFEMRSKCGDTRWVRYFSGTMDGDLEEAFRLCVCNYGPGRQGERAREKPEIV